MTGGERKAGDLTPFCSRLAATWLAESPAVRHRRLAGTLVSADLSGFTAMSERLAAKGKAGAEELTAAINGCFTALIAVADTEGGDVLKFGGDALLLWFDGDDHARRAVRAAARMQQTIGAARFARAGLSMSVGGHSGEFDMYLVGRDDWRELVLAGRPVTTTVDLEATATSGQVLVSAATAVAVPDRWCTPAGDACQVVVDAVEDDESVRPDPRAVPGNVAARLVAPHLQAEVQALAATAGEHRLATIVFAEVEGTDDAVAAAGPAFADSLDALVRAVEDDADRYGTLFLYTDVVAGGVKVIVVAGAPVSTGNDEEAALRFATDLVHGDPQHKLRAGVNRGRVFAGFLGSPDRRTYTVMGDPVNLAARLMAKAEQGQVVASDDTVTRSRAEFELTALEPFLVKGKAEPITAHVVGGATGDHRSQSAIDLPLVGREAEVAQLREAIAAAAAGSGRVVEIVGDAGIGKTRLLEAIRDDPRVVARVATECQPYDALSPFAGVRPLLRAALGIPGDADPAAAGAALQERAAAVAPGVVPLLPLVAVAVGAEVPATPEAAAIAGEFRQARMHEAVIDLLVASLPSTTLLEVEDVYYVDDASLQLLRLIAATVPERPWALVITRRPEGPGLVVGEVDGVLVKLQPLAGDGAVRLAELAASRLDIGAAELDAMVERSGGNPLFVLELVGAASAGLTGDDVPESIESLVATRVDRLDPADRTLLRHAAVVGRVFDTAIVRRLLADSAPRDDSWRRLGEYVEPEAGSRWRFRHALFRDVAYEGLPFARRRRLHRSVGELLEGGFAGEPDPAHLSLHFWLAGDAARTWRYSVVAGDAAWAGFAVSEAVAAYRRALEVRRRVRGLDPMSVSAVAESLGDALERSASYDDAGRMYALARRAGRDGHEPHDVARILRKVGELDERAGRFSGALRTYTRARRLVEGSADPAARKIQAKLAIAYAGVCHRQGRHRASADWAKRAVLEAQRAGVPGDFAHAQSLLVLAALHGEAEDGETLGRLALEVFESEDDAVGSGMTNANLGTLAYFAGDWNVAVDRYRRSADAYRRGGDVAGQSLALNNLGEVLSDQGRYEEALDALTRANRSWTAARYAIGTAVSVGNLGRLAARMGDFERAHVLLAEAVERFTTIGAGEFVIETMARQAEAFVRAGDVQSASAVLDEAAEHPNRAAAHPSSLALLERASGWVALARGDTASALECMRAALARAEEHGLDFDAAQAVDGLAAAARAAGDPSWRDTAADAEHRLERLGVVTTPFSARTPPAT